MQLVRDRVQIERVDGMIARANSERREQLRTFLKGLRQRIDPKVRTLGAHVRLPLRCGRPVTQEELAEAIGVSRAWYGMLESGATIRASTQLLDRLADALTLTPHERAILFCLAVPELEHLLAGPFLGNGAGTDRRARWSEFAQG